MPRLPLRVAWARLPTGLCSGGGGSGGAAAPSECLVGGQCLSVPRLQEASGAIRSSIRKIKVQNAAPGRNRTRQARADGALSDHTQKAPTIHRRMPFSAASALPLLCLMLVSAVADPRSSENVELVRDGQAVARVYIAKTVPPDPAAEGAGGKGTKSAPSRRAAAVEDLNYHLRKMSGADLPVIYTDDPSIIKGPAIVLGRLALELGASPQKTSESREGFRLLTRDGLILIGGESEDAESHGIYELLRRLGCDWVMPGTIGEIIPHRSTVSVPRLDESQAPDFSMRRLWYRGGRRLVTELESQQFDRWLARQKGGRWEHPASRSGGHVWDRFIKRHQDEFERDPTMYALTRASDGTLKREGPQLESTHPRVIELFVEEIRAAYRKNIAAGRWTRRTQAGFGIGPADGLDYSVSAESIAAGSGRIDPIMGEPDRTDLLVLLGNQILERVQNDYPNAYVGFYSYSAHADYPMRYKPHPNIVIIFAPINFSRFHGALDPRSKTQSYYRGVVEQWAKLSREQGNVLIYRGYNWNLADNMLPFSKVGIWGEELPFYRRNGVISLNVEATKAWSVNGPSDYVFMRLAWDSGLNWPDLLTEYCRKAFGPAAVPMEQYFLRIIKRQSAAGQEAGSYHAYHLIYDEAWIRESRSLIDEALTAAKASEDRLRVSAFAAGLEALRLYLDYHGATLRFDFAGAKQAFDAMLANWRRAHDVDSQLVAQEVPDYLDRYLREFVEEGLRYSQYPYNVVYRIPDELPTAFDPHGVGDRMNFHSAAIDDRRFIKTLTYSSTWDAQGIAGLQSSAAWYRIRFMLPASLKGQPIGLFIGGVQDEARVWLNGRPVGRSGRQFSTPVVFDLTDETLFGGENLLALQIVRNSAANEIGVGGLLRPSFLFTGPRLERKAPEPLEDGK